MVLAPSFALGRKRDHDVRSNGAEHADEVPEDLLLSPFLERLLDAEGVAELVGAREILLDAVHAVHRHELFRAQDSDRLEELGSDLVLSAVSPGRREERRAVPTAPAQEDEETVVLVVRMRGGMKEARSRGELSELEREADAAAVLGDRLELGRGGRRE